MIFLGAGASAACADPDGVRPPTWPQLLADALKLARTADAALVQSLLDKEQFLDAAEIVFSGIDAPESREFFRAKFATPKFKHSAIHASVLEIDPKIVITTNYDCIYDEYCTKGRAQAGYSVRRHSDDNVLDEIRSTARVVLKAHGCVSDTTKLVLSRSQYYGARAKFPAFYALLDSLFLCNTLLFVGYGLKDPDIQLLLENANIAVPSKHPHYALISKGTHAAVAEAYRRAHNVRLIEYENPDGSHQNAVLALNALAEQVTALRAKYSGLTK